MQLYMLHVDILLLCMYISHDFEEGMNICFEIALEYLYCVASCKNTMYSYNNILYLVSVHHAKHRQGRDRERELRQYSHSSQKVLEFEKAHVGWPTPCGS